MVLGKEQPNHIVRIGQPQGDLLTFDSLSGAPLMFKTGLERNFVFEKVIPESFRYYFSREPPSKIIMVVLAQQDYVSGVSSTIRGLYIDMVSLHDVTPHFRCFNVASHRCKLMRWPLAQTDLAMTCVLIEFQIIDLFFLPSCSSFCFSRTVNWC